MNLSEKYVAGFLDSDGSFGVKFARTDTGHKPVLTLAFSQETRRDKVLHLIQDVTGGTIHQIEQYSVLSVPSKKARLFLSRISKYLVLKRHFADYCLAFVQEHSGKSFDVEQVRSFKADLKQERKRNPYPIPNFPARKWVAGYFDGDGCIGVSYRKKTGCSYLSARIVADNHYECGLQLLQKAFGGRIYRMKRPQGHSHPYWVMHMPPSKVKQFVGYFAKHSVVKRDELYFILRCAEGGNFRDGKTIQNTLKHLKAQEQRLNDPSADIRYLVDCVDFNIKSARWKDRPTEYRVSDSPAQKDSVTLFGDGPHGDSQHQLNFPVGV